MESYVEEKTSVRNQYLAAIIVNIMGFCQGCAEGWVSPTLLLLAGDESPLGEPLTPSQASLIASLICVGGLVGTPVFGWLADRLGRKPASMIAAIPFTISWIMKLSWRSAHGLMAARFIAGLGSAGVFLLTPLYGIEVGSLATRGALGSLMMFALNIGVVFMYTLGSYSSYNTTLSVMIVIPIVFLVLMIWMPETPPYLVKNNKDKKAMEAIAWLRRLPVDSPVVKGVFDNLKYEEELAKSPANTIPIKVLGVSESELPVKKTDIEEIPPWKLLFTSPPARRAFTVVFLLLIVQCFVGLFAIITFASEIFVEAGSQMSPAISSIVVGLLQIVGSLGGSVLVERLGRKILLIVSCGAVFASMGTMGTFFYAKSCGYDVSAIGWIPVTSLSVAVATYAVGIGPIPYMLPSEMMMVQVRSVAMSILCILVWIAAFLLNQFYESAVSTFGSHGVFWTFSFVGGCGVFITIFMLPETKGKPLDEIIAHFGGDRSRTIKKGKEPDDIEFI